MSDKTRDRVDAALKRAQDASNDDERRETPRIERRDADEMIARIRAAGCGGCPAKPSPG